MKKCGLEILRAAREIKRVRLAEKTKLSKENAPPPLPTSPGAPSVPKPPKPDIIIKIRTDSAENARKAEEQAQKQAE
jgi:hypothetical protein